MERRRREGAERGERRIEDGRDLEEKGGGKERKREKEGRKSGKQMEKCGKGGKEMKMGMKKRETKVTTE